MNKTTFGRGMEMLPNILNLYITNSDVYFLGISSSLQLRHRCFIKIVKKTPGKIIVYFHLTNKEETEMFKNLIPFPSLAFLYGSYPNPSNGLEVYQIKCQGSLKVIIGREKNKFKELVAKRLNGNSIGDQLPSKPSPHEKGQTLQSLKEGKSYRFDPELFMYRIYKREATSV